MELIPALCVFVLVRYNITTWGCNRCSIFYLQNDQRYRHINHWYVCHPLPTKLETNSHVQPHLPRFRAVAALFI